MTCRGVVASCGALRTNSGVAESRADGYFVLITRRDPLANVIQRSPAVIASGNR
jgi:hypothetical protein